MNSTNRNSRRNRSTSGSNDNAIVVLSSDTDDNEEDTPMVLGSEESIDVVGTSSEIIPISRSHQQQQTAARILGEFISIGPPLTATTVVETTVTTTPPALPNGSVVPGSSSYYPTTDTDSNTANDTTTNDASNNTTSHHHHHHHHSPTNNMNGVRVPIPRIQTSSSYYNNNSSGRHPYYPETSRRVRGSTMKRCIPARNPAKKCYGCDATESPEWRRGPEGMRTLCNSCGLQYAKHRVWPLPWAATTVNTS